MNFESLTVMDAVYLHEVYGYNITIDGKELKVEVINDDDM